MIFKLFRAEAIKLRRSPLWLMFVFVPLIPAFLGTANYLANIEILKSEWYSLWSQHTLFTDYFFLPIMVSVYCARLMTLEHNSHGWNRLLTVPAGRGLIFVSKLMTAGLMVLLTMVWIGILFVASGYIAGLREPPVRDILIWCAGGFGGGMVLAAVQLLISMALNSFALPVGIGFAGGLSGLVFLARHLGHVWPYSLMGYGMASNAPQKISERGYLPFVLICIGYLVVFTAAGAVLVRRRGEMGS